ncbi:uncharacterized protein J3R85_008034 [Psidium guajava]|nr:uncharacterized protein J3R85_008034 [Psidium guajava]
MANLLSSLSLFFIVTTVVHRQQALSLTFPSDVAALKAFKSAVVPSSIAPCLAVLDLSDNSFRGPIPSSLSSLSALTTLSLRANSFSGSVPALTGLKTLQSLDLSYNSLSGSLPSSLSALPSLTRLDLSFNRLTGSIPKLPPNLVELALRGNSLSGPLSKDSFAESAQLEVVELGHNSLAGALEPWLFLLPSVQQIDLANNSLARVDVTTPRAGGGSSLVAVDLGFNRIEGYVPGSFASYPQLSSLSLRYNRLRGDIPAEFGRKATLRRLFLDGNYLTGKPPKGLFSGEATVAFGSLGDNCLRECPARSQLCVPSQKPDAVCKQAYGGRPRS